jgi:hypothetical protein
MRTFLVTICCLFCAVKAHSQTLNWGSEDLGIVVNSNGVEVDNTFVFELGAFNPGFDPELNPMSDWYSNWQVFDFTTYNADINNRNFEGSVYINNDPNNPAADVATSSNPTASQMNFSGLDAYVWVRKGNDPIAGSEWLLARADWVFPSKGAACCGLGLIEWSASDIGAAVPLWGRQYGVRGPGEGEFDSGTYDYATSPLLQTFTFIPEPSAFLLSAVAAIGMVLRRRRSSDLVA